MATFLTHLGLAYLAATLGVTGIAHALTVRRVIALIGEHGVVPRRLAPLAGVLLVALEVVVAVAAAVAVHSGGALRPVVLALGAAAGLAFFLYVRRLLQVPGSASSCGCSPIASSLTPASLAPAAALGGVSLVGLLAIPLDSYASLRLAYQWVGTGMLLPLGWGATLSLLVMLWPGSVRAR